MTLIPSFWQAAWVYWVKACQRLSWSNGNSATKNITTKFNGKIKLIIVHMTGDLSFSFIDCFLVYTLECIDLVSNELRFLSFGTFIF